MRSLRHACGLSCRRLQRLFCFIVGRRPRSTRFPYTTLFRSCPTSCLELTQDFELATYSRAGFVWNREMLEQDRKSTRLNSSHLVISYAVFCLKKKNTAGAGRRSQQRTAVRTALL